MEQVRDCTPTRTRREVTHQPGALQQERLSRKERGVMEATCCLLHEKEPLDFILNKWEYLGFASLSDNAGKWSPRGVLLNLEGHQL